MNLLIASMDVNNTLRDVNSLCSSIQTIHENYIVLTRMIRKENSFYPHIIIITSTLDAHLVYIKKAFIVVEVLYL